MEEDPLIAMAITPDGKSRSRRSSRRSSSRQSSHSIHSGSASVPVDDLTLGDAQQQQTQFQFQAQQQIMTRVDHQQGRRGRRQSKGKRRQPASTTADAPQTLQMAPPAVTTTSASNVTPEAGDAQGGFPEEASELTKKRPKVSKTLFRDGHKLVPGDSDEEVEEDASSDDILEQKRYKKIASLIEQALEKSLSIESATLEEHVKLIKAITKELAKRDQYPHLHRTDIGTLTGLLDYSHKLVRPALKINLDVDPDSLAVVVAAVDAAVMCLAVLSLPSMPKQLFMEDMIEHCSQLAKNHLTKSIYPLCSDEPDARQDAAKREGLKRRPSSLAGRLGPRRKLYYQLTHLIRSFTELTARHTLGDQILLDLCKFSVEAIFVSGLHDLKVVAVDLATRIFSSQKRHRETIIHEIFTNYSELSTSKRNIRTYEIEPGKNIQVFSALILNILQSTFSGNISKAPKDSAIADVILDSSKELSGLMQNIIVHLSHRIETAASDVQYNILFTNMVEDVCACSFSPQWPVAFDFLMAIVTRMNQILGKTDANASLPLRQVAAEALQRALFTFAKARKATRALSLESVHVDDDWMEKFRDFELADSIAFENALLHAYHEGSSSTRVAKLYFLCRLIARAAQPSRKQSHVTHTQQHQQQQQQQAEADLPNSQDDLLNSTDDSSFVSLKLQQAYTREEDLVSLLREPESYNFGCVMEDENGTTVLLEAIQTQWYTKRWAACLNVIQLLRKDGLSTIRTRALKTISSLVADHGDPEVVKLAVSAVKCHSLDMSPSVRESTLELLSTLISFDPTFATQLADIINTALQDVAVSVRKRTMKLLQDQLELVVDSASIDNTCALLTSLLQRIKDEESSIKVLVKMTFSDLWFSSRCDVDVVVDMICGVRRELMKRMGTQEHLQLLFALALAKKKEGDAEFEALRYIVNALFHKLSGRDELGVMPILKMIGDSVFVLLEPFVMKVAQFFHRLVTSKAMDSPTLMDTLEVMRMCLHSTASISDREAAVIESDLASVVLRGPGRALQAAVHAWKISTDHSTNLLLPKQILETAYDKLLKVADQSGSKQELRRQVPRCLLICGVICRYFNLDLADEEGNIIPLSEIPQEVIDAQKNPNRELSEESITDVVFIVLNQFCLNDDEAIAEAALSALGHFFVMHKQLSMRKESLDLFKKHLASDSERLRCQATESLELILVEEELEMEAKAQSDAKREGKLSRMGGGDESGVSAVLMATLERHIHANATYPSHRVRRATMKLLEVVQRRGLVNPMNFIDVLVSLTMDFDASGSLFATSAMARKLLQDLSKTHYDFLVSRGRDAVLGVYKAQRNIQERHPTRGFVLVEGDMRPLLQYLHSLLKRASDRKMFATGLVDISIQQNAAEVDWELTVYSVDNLALLDFQTQEEVVAVLVKLQKFLSIKTSKLVMDTRKALGLAMHEDLSDFTAEQLLSHIDEENSASVHALLLQQHQCLMLGLLRYFLVRKYHIDVTVQPLTALPKKPLRMTSTLWNPETCNVLESPHDMGISGLLGQFLKLSKLDDADMVPDDFAPFSGSSFAVSRAGSTAAAKKAIRRRSSKSFSSAARRKSIEKKKKKQEKAKKQKKRKKLGEEDQSDDDSDFDPSNFV